MEQTLPDALRRLGTIAAPAIELFDQLPDVPFWIKDTEGRFRWVNTAMVLLNGRRTRDEVIGQTDSTFSEATRASQFLHDDARVLAGQRVIGRIELIVFNHIGRWYTTSKLPLQDARSRVVGTVGLAVPHREGGQGIDEGGALAAAMTFISRNYREPLTNTRIAKACGMSVRAFERQFRNSYDCTPHTYVRHLRVRLSCEALVYSNRSLTDIAEEHGFSDQSHFTKEFHNTMAMTPRAYRARYRP